MRIPPILLLLTTLLAPPADAGVSADVSRPGDGAQPVRVTMAMFLLDLDGIDNVNQSFEANLYFRAKWRDPRLAHPGPGKISRPLEEVWHPRLQILNEQRTWSTFPEVVRIDSRGDVTYRQRLWGSFSQPLDLHDFPFDSQRFEIPIVAAGYGSGEVEMVADTETSSGIGKSFSIPDWDMVEWNIEAGAIDPASNLRDALASFTFSFTAKRRHLFYVAKVIIPLVLIMAMSWVVFWMDPKDGGSGQIGISVTAMLTLIAYTFAANATLPRVPYLTRLDYFILSGTVLVFLALMEVAVTSVQARRGRVKLARRIDRWARWAFPLMFLLMTAKSLGFRLLL